MTQAKGFRSRLLLDFEDTFGSDPGVSEAQVMHVNSVGLRANRGKQIPATIRGNRNAAEPFDGFLDVSGPIVVPIDYTSFWYWLKAMFNLPATTGGGPYTHVFTIGNTQPSMVLDKQVDQDIAQYHKYNGCKIARASFSFGGESELVANLQLAGADETRGTSPYDAAPTSPTLNRLDNFEAAMTEGSASIATVLSVDMSIDFGLDTGQYCIGGSGKRRAIGEGMVQVTGSVRALFEDDTLLTKAENSTESEITVTVTTGAYSLAFEIPELMYGRGGAAIEGPQGIIQTLDFAGFYGNDTDASSMVVTLINATAADSSSSSSSSSNSSSSSSSSSTSA